MKALTLWQPWATLIAQGNKKIETRSWGANYRGPLAIHAAERFPTEAQKLCRLELFRSAISDADLPRGCVVAIVEVLAVLRIDMFFALPAEPELSFGDYTVGRYAWYLHLIRMLEKPVPARGALGLWEWNSDTT